MNFQIQKKIFSSINPQVNYLILNPLASENKYGPRVIYDYHFRYVVEGMGKIILGKETYDVKKGDLIFTPPAIVHDMLTDKDNPLILYGIHFNFYPTNAKFTSALVGDVDNFNINDVEELVEFTDFEGFPPCINCLSNPKIVQIFSDMLKTYKSQRRFYHVEINGMLKSFLSVVAQHISMQSAKMDSFNNNYYVNANRSVETIIAYIYENFNEKLTYESLGDVFHFHPNHINRLVQAYSGKSLRQYVISTRIKRATDLLLHSDMSITEISNCVGYEDMNYFFKVFKKKTGFTPSQIKSQN